MNKIRRTEYPRPQFERSEWMTLNGLWDFSFEQEIYDQKICVPFAYESKLSGIGSKDFYNGVWYRRSFCVPDEWKGKNVILHFGAVDYECDIWVNNKHAICHVGGQTSFHTDITQLLEDGENIIKVHARDFHQDLDIPRGKQYWKKESASIFYTATTGIWQSVWMEPVFEHYIKQVLITPLFDEKSVKFEYELENSMDYYLETEIYFKDKLAAKTSVMAQKKGSYTVKLDEAALGAWNWVEDLAWTPETPRLFDVKYALIKENTVIDKVTSYFGMRKVSIENGKFLLNNRPYYQRLILDQGYWPEGLLTAPSDDAFIQDIMLAKKMGFNGVRKHQKVEDPRFLYHADCLGFLVWGEIGAGYAYSRRLALDTIKEWSDVVLRDYNHPCIVVWTPLNESWGVMEIAQSKEQQNFCKALCALTKALDTTRPVSDNDGWEHVGGDLLTIHDYESQECILEKRYQTVKQILEDQPAGRALYVTGYAYRMEPIIISEFGGISFTKDDSEGWGYSTAHSEEDFLSRLKAVVHPILKSPHVQGFCYTQLTDVEQEINGLVTYERKPKADFQEIYNIICGIE